MKTLCHDPKERERILERRVKVLDKAADILIADEADDVTESRLAALRAEHGHADVTAALRRLMHLTAFRELTQHMTPKQRKRARYNEYLSSYRRYGAGLEFLPFNEFHRQLGIFEAVAREIPKGTTLTVAAAEEMDRIAKRLLATVTLMEDILPEIPPIPIPEYFPSR